MALGKARTLDTGEDDSQQELHCFNVKSKAMQTLMPVRLFDTKSSEPRLQICLNSEGLRIDLEPKYFPHEKIPSDFCCSLYLFGFSFAIKEFGVGVYFSHKK